MIQVNYLAILVCGIIGMAIGAFWHSKALFGNAYMKIIGVDMNMSPEKMKEIQKEMWKLYLTQFILLLVQLFVLAHFITVLKMTGASGVVIAFAIWLGFILPTCAASAMWSNKLRAMAWKLFFITAGYQLVSLLIFGAILSAWQ